MTYEQETLWLAGWLEGEGSFMCRPNCNEVRITVGSTDEDVVRRAAAICGNRRVYSDEARKKRLPHYQTLWRFEILGDDAIEVAKRILPFMGQRRKTKIEFLLVRAANRISRSESGRRGGFAKAANRRKLEPTLIKQAV